MDHDDKVTLLIALCSYEDVCRKRLESLQDTEAGARVAAFYRDELVQIAQTRGKVEKLLGGTS